jgi:hypothetical protein
LSSFALSSFKIVAENFIAQHGHPSKTIGAHYLLDRSADVDDMLAGDGSAGALKMWLAEQQRPYCFTQWGTSFLRNGG